MTLNVTAFDCAPPGLISLTAMAPGALIRFAGIETVNVEELMKVACSSVAPNRICGTLIPTASGAAERSAKFAPFTVIVRPALPNTIDGGLNEVTTGASKVKGNAALAVLSGCTTATLVTPGAAIN